jgi:diguanylate cyclase (GGDEF)-like protein/PAS domain S-box-containing protein
MAPAAALLLLVLGLVLGGTAGSALLAGLAAVTLGLWLRAAARGRRLERDRHRYRLAAAAFPGAMLVLDRGLRQVLVTGRGLEQLGLSPRAREGRTLAELVDRDAYVILEPVCRAALEGGESHLELHVGGGDQLLHVVPLRTGAAVTGAMLVAQDVTERKRREHRLTQAATRDGLTGVWNRGYLWTQVERLLDTLGHCDPAGTLVLLDLNGFKEVNDTHGHHAGDELLRSVSRAIERSVRTTDVVARLGGDEFAVLLPGAGPEGARQVASSMAAAIDDAWPGRGEERASIGLAAVGGPNRTPAAAFAAADRAMYAVKRQRLSEAS